MASSWYHDEFERTLGKCGLVVCPLCRGQGRVSQPVKGWLGWKLSIRPCPGCSGVGMREVVTHGK